MLFDKPFQILLWCGNITVCCTDLAPFHVLISLMLTDSLACHSHKSSHDLMFLAKQGSLVTFLQQPFFPLDYSVLTGAILLYSSSSSVCIQICFVYFLFYYQKCIDEWGHDDVFWLVNVLLAPLWRPSKQNQKKYGSEEQNVLFLLSSFCSLLIWLGRAFLEMDLIFLGLEVIFRLGPPLASTTWVKERQNEQMIESFMTK